GRASRKGRRLRLLGPQPHAAALDRLQACQRWPRHARDPGLLGPSVDCLDRALHRPRAGSLQALLAGLRADKDQCWHWLAVKTAHGYGVMVIDGRNVLAHRISYALVHGWQALIPGMLMSPRGPLARFASGGQKNFHTSWRPLSMSAGDSHRRAN